jgi:hypothetical protein
MSTTGLVRFRLTPDRQAIMAACFTAVVAIAMGTWWVAMRSGVRALDAMRN